MRPKFDSSEGIFFTLELEAYRDFIDFNEKNIEKEINKINKEFDNLQKNFDREPLKYDAAMDFMEQDFIDDLKKLDNEFRQNLRRSQIILLYSFLEVKLRDGCNSYASFHNKEYSVSNLRGQNDLDKIKLFFKKSMHIKVNELNPEWNFLDNLRKVRNKIVHHNGIIKKVDNDYAAISQFSENRFQLNADSRSENYVIELSDNRFLSEIIENISKLYHKILNLEINQLKENKPNT